MTWRRSPVTGAALALTVAAFVAVLTARPAAPPVDRYASSSYSPSGYRAWAELLAREGVATTRFRLRPIELDGSVDTLISAQDAAGFGRQDVRTPADLAALATWVRAGGRLLYLGREGTLTGPEKTLLALPSSVGPTGGATLPGGSSTAATLRGPLAASVATLDRLGPTRLRPASGVRAELSDGAGDIIARYRLGRGDVIAVADPAPFSNAAIAAPGNARLAYLLGLPRRSHGVVAFDDGLHGGLIDRPWYRALPLPVRVGLGIAAVAVVVGLAGLALPVGPPVRLNPPREPTSAEFVAALAALHERIGARAPAARVLGRDALDRAARAAGLRAGLPPAEIARRLGERGADAERLGQLLDTPIADDTELLAAAQLALRVRKEWGHDRIVDGRRAAFAGRARARRRR